MDWYWWVLIGVAVILVLCTLAGWLLYSTAVLRKQSNKAAADAAGSWEKYMPFINGGIAFADSLPGEDISLKSRDGLVLHAKYYANEGSHRTVLFAHGYRSQGKRDFGGYMPYYREHGYNILLIDQRAHGESEGKYICYGVKERFDVAIWAQYLEKRFPDDSVYLHGLSMGAATVLMASGLQLADNVKAIVADCGFTSPGDEFAHVMRTVMKLPIFPLLHIANIFCRACAGFDVHEYSTIDAMKVNDLPIMFLHGERDNFVPYWMSQEAFEICKTEKEFYSSPESTHATTFMDDPETVSSAIFDFLARY